MNGYYDGKNPDPLGKFTFIAIMFLLIMMIVLQVGIAKGRQMEKDSVKQYQSQ